MYAPNVQRIVELAGDGLVLDVGGWYRPFNRADVVVDLLPYETRGLGGHDGPPLERFDRTTWLTQDICARRLPFPDGTFDFAVCSHTLEDVRDPIFVCSELVRVARCGYVEVPSRAIESVRGLEGRNYAGYYHHRWLVEIEGQQLSFRVKPHAIHEDRRYYLPRRFLRGLRAEDRVQWLFWDTTFSFKEVIQVSHLETRRELAAFVAHTAPVGRLESLGSVISAPLRTRQYGWRVVRHPLDSHVAPDTFEGQRVWDGMSEIATP